MVAVFSMMFRVPMPNPSLDFTDIVEAALLSQVSEIADQVCNGMLVTGAAAPLKNRDASAAQAMWFISHALPSLQNNALFSVNLHPAPVGKL